MNVLGEADSRPATAKSLTAIPIWLSVEAVETLIYHLLESVLYWIGCPTSPEFLSDTLLTIERLPPSALNIRLVGLVDASKVRASL